MITRIFQNNLFILLLYFTSGLPFLSLAQVTKTWDGGAGTNDWHTAANWDPTGVPGITDVVEIENDSVSITAAVVTVQQLYLDNAQLYIPLGLPVTIESAGSSFDAGIKLGNASILYNQGVITIRDGAQEGLRLDDSQFLNLPSARLFILDPRTTGIALYDSELRNDEFAVVSARSAGDAGILLNSTSTLTNRVDAYADVSYAGDKGIINQGYIVNRGHLRVFSPADRGIENFDSLINQNQGLIEIDSASIGILNYADFINYGDLTISNSKDSGTGIQNTPPVSTIAIFHNYGAIEIVRTENEGIGLASTGTFTNHHGGKIYIDETLNPLSEGIFVSDIAHLINNGLIKIDGGTTSGLKVTGFVTNSDSLLITNISEVGLLLEENSVINEPTGLIQIQDCGTSLQVDSSAIFDCKGLLDIRN